MNASPEVRNKWRQKAKKEKEKKMKFAMEMNADLFSDMSDEDFPIERSSKKPPTSLNIDKICKMGSSDAYKPPKALLGPQAPPSRQEIFGAAGPSRICHKVPEKKPSALLKYRYGSLSHETLAQSSSVIFSQQKSSAVPAIIMPKKSFKKKKLQQNKTK